MSEPVAAINVNVKPFQGLARNEHRGWWVNMDRTQELAEIQRERIVWLSPCTGFVPSVNSAYGNAAKRLSLRLLSRFGGTRIPFNSKPFLLTWV